MSTEQNMPSVVAELHADSLSLWERLGEGASTKEKATNLRGLGFGG